MTWRGFASDNYAAVHPVILDAMVRANVGHQGAYGNDDVTMALGERIRHTFGDRAEVYPVFNGTGANVVALQAATRRWEAVICSRTAHVHADEGGAPEHAAGIKLWPVMTPDGKLTPALIDTEAFDFGFVHRAQPGAVTITQSSELGTVYTPEEIRAIADHVHAMGLALHMDGARLANAAAALDVPLRALTTDAGVDVLSFGGTKNGAMLAEAVVVLDPDRVPGVDFLRKTSMQLASKMRFLSAQLLALLTDDLWLANARHANAMAQLLRSRVETIPQVVITQAVQSNAVFARLPREATERLQEEFHFYTWDASTGEVRWMCSWDTTTEDVERFATALERALP